MDMVEKLVSEDPAIKGIWCVPKYSNPQGYTYSEETVKRFANLKPAAPDFRIYWDNAYSVHHLYDDEKDQDFLLEILDECAKAGNPDMVYKFTSTSKISFPGSGIAALAASKANLDDIRKYITVQTIGHDKLNQLRHVKFFKDLEGVHAHMKKHAAILRPKFEMVEATLEKVTWRTWNRRMDNTKGWIFYFLRIPGRMCKKDRSNGKRSRCRNDRSRSYLPIWQRPKRQQYPYCSVIPAN